MRILGIETSCDETALAIVEGKGERVRVARELVASQVKIHKKYGGVVPEVAARRHAEVMPWMLKKMLGRERARAFDVIAVTAGPGLITSLRVGVDTARSLAYAWGKPLVAVNHLAGHIAANFIDEITNTKYQIPNTKFQIPNSNRKSLSYKPFAISRARFPALALVVSGGHTELVLMRDHGVYELLGATRDDAAGEAFDKVGKLLGLGYPGGPAVAKRAEKGDPHAIPFPRPMIHSKDFDFSFSGLKTAVAQYLDVQHPVGHPDIADICASFQEAAVDVLVEKTIRAARRVKPKTILLAGGVAANKELRKRLGIEVARQLPTANCRPPPMKFTTDNAAMIAAAGYFMARKKQFADWRTLEPRANWEIGAE
ncbi:tRNA (adenosine(37)-N6)-threonylcarbamoyltransferase complex transferase subunit TsaD [Patescibacteria group bacterium]|nr:MAG: tRNA (adenosine(37)-N6)-threonylcarbamoyltransferase complex transferase subunit TsaD [Patescibacteria group bacterium]